MSTTHPRPAVYQTPALPSTKPLLQSLSARLGDSRYVVVTAAIEAFAAMPVAEQAKHLAQVRERRASGLAGTA